MTVAICSNEHNLLWVFDDRLPQKWGTRPDRIAGTYSAVAAAFVGDPLEVVFLEETESKKVLLADPQWASILAYLGIEFGNLQGEVGFLAEYIDFASPYASSIKFAALDYAQEFKSGDINDEIFYLKAWGKYDLKRCQVKAAIRYAKRISRGCKTVDEFAEKLDAVFEKVKTIERLHLSPIAAKIDFETNSTVTSVVGDFIPEIEATTRKSAVDSWLDFDTAHFAPR
jgi:hypothetical protein